MASSEDLNTEVAPSSRISTAMLLQIISMRGNRRKNALETMLQLLDEPVSSPWKMIILETALTCEEKSRSNLAGKMFRRKNTKL